MKPSTLAFALVLAGASFAGAADDEAQVKRGEALVTKLCAPCHAVGRTGTSPRAEAPAFRTLGKRYKIESLEEALGEGLISGHPDMPEFRFEPDDIGAVIVFLKSIQER
jgi:mono/diheme cytochrome c family protein